MHLKFEFEVWDIQLCDLLSNISCNILMNLMLKNCINLSITLYNALECVLYNDFHTTLYIVVGLVRELSTTTMCGSLTTMWGLLLNTPKRCVG